MIVINPLGSSGVSLSYIAQTDVGTGDVRAGKKFIYPSGKIATGTGHILAMRSGTISCGLNPEDITINTGLKSISAFVMFRYDQGGSYGSKFTAAMYGGNIKLCQICSSNRLSDLTSNNISIIGGNVTIKGLYHDYGYSDLGSIPWFAVGYTE